MIYIEILIVVVIIAYALVGIRRGFLSQFFDLLGIAISFILALRYFSYFAKLFEQLGLNQNIAKPAGFFTLWIILQIVFYVLTLVIFRYLPKEIDENKVNRYLGIIPGFVKGVLIVAIILMIFFISPIPQGLKDGLSQGALSGFLIKYSAKVEMELKKVFGNVNSLSFFTTLNQNGETTQLNFKTDQYTIDEISENAMIVLVNNERAKVGLSPVKIDYTIRTVARNHSIDMAKNGYFSHIDLAGKTPADRMVDGKVDFWLAGENIALAPSYELAQIGFMNSPKHRDNILDPKYSRIGIGIIDLGVYGKMVTQNFAN